MHSGFNDKLKTLKNQLNYYNHPSIQLKLRIKHILHIFKILKNNYFNTKLI